ncbi:hypothetical protein [Caulobacter sp. 17J65-9]|uniref:hypothetical protein n=1 Tax=Caulobacter sp. 17J65-9 TaxID=2709382 RepID=UPI0013C5EFE9|nr:hypothetical protein [Caulobacter sp. 17J65-9]NEX93316.1 hypothetical protein [Caulobacter sp. 17J65-9]
MTPIEIANWGIGLASLAGFVAAGVVRRNPNRRRLSTRLGVSAVLGISIASCLGDYARNEERERESLSTISEANAYVADRRKSGGEAVRLMAEVYSNPLSDDRLRADSRELVERNITALADAATKAPEKVGVFELHHWAFLGFALAYALFLLPDPDLLRRRWRVENSDRVSGPLTQ